MKTASLFGNQGNQNAVQILGNAYNSANKNKAARFSQSASTSSASTPTDTASLSPEAQTISLIKKMAQSGQYKTAMAGSADDALRAAARNGELPKLAKLSDSQYMHLTKAEQNLYSVITTLQSLYDYQPRTLEDALERHVKMIKESYPESIARMQQGLADGTLKEEDGWSKVIAQYQDELRAAQEGKMEIHAVNDPSLIKQTEYYTVTSNAYGWSGTGEKTEANHAALKNLYPNKNVLAGGNTYVGTYVITW